MMTPEHEERLRRLLASWRLRKNASNDQQQSLLSENMEAVEAALVSASTAVYLEERISIAIKTLSDIRDNQTGIEKFSIGHVIRILKGDS